MDVPSIRKAPEQSGAYFLRMRVRIADASIGIRWIAPQRCAARLADARERWSELRANTRSTNKKQIIVTVELQLGESGKLRVLIVVATANR
jgi:hypothetical protein